MISTDDIDDFGVPAIIKRIRERIGDSPVYLRCVHTPSDLMVNETSEIHPIHSLDIDVVGMYGYFRPFSVFLEKGDRLIWIM